MTDDSIFAPDFSETPFWWRAAPPRTLPQVELPARCDVVVIGGGYAGLNAARTLIDGGASVCVLEADRVGAGASTRNGGIVSGGANVGKSTNLVRTIGEARYRELLRDARASLAHFEETVEAESIDCDRQPVGRFTGANTPAALEGLRAKVERLAQETGGAAYLVPREAQRQIIASDFYHGGMIVERTIGIHPARYHAGLLEAVLRRGAVVTDHTPALTIQGGRGAFRIGTPHGEVAARDVLVAVNGYAGSATPWERRRLIPVASDVIATEELGEQRVRELFPGLHMMGETRRVLNYFRPSPDRKRIIFGGRASFWPESRVWKAAKVLHGRLRAIFPQLEDVRISNAWSGKVAFTLRRIPHMGEHDGVHYCMGCNGSGVAMMSYLGHQTALKLLGAQDRPCAFGQIEPGTMPLYNGVPWFLPAVGGWYALRDRIDQLTG